MQICTNRTPRSTSRRAIRQRVPYSRVVGLVDAVQLVRGFAFGGDVERFLGGDLHPGGQLVAGDARGQVLLARDAARDVRD